MKKLSCRDDLERQELIMTITRWTSRYGTDAQVEFWAIMRRLFLVDCWNDNPSWQLEAAKVLGISYLAFRQRKYQFEYWINASLFALDPPEYEPAGEIRRAA